MITTIFTIIYFIVGVSIFVSTMRSGVFTSAVDSSLANPKVDKYSTDSVILLMLLIAFTSTVILWPVTLIYVALRLIKEYIETKESERGH